MNLASVERLQPGRSILRGIYSFLEDFDYDLDLAGDQCSSAFSGQRKEEGNLLRKGVATGGSEGCPMTWGPGAEGAAKS